MEGLSDWLHSCVTRVFFSFHLYGIFWTRFFCRITNSYSEKNAVAAVKTLTICVLTVEVHQLQHKNTEYHPCVQVRQQEPIFLKVDCKPRNYSAPILTSTSHKPSECFFLSLPSHHCIHSWKLSIF